jgi:hypothetical protein
MLRRDLTAVSVEDCGLLGCSATPHKTYNFNFLVCHKLDFTFPITGS